jgi:hypothetical protein
MYGDVSSADGYFNYDLLTCAVFLLIFINILYVGWWAISIRNISWGLLTAFVLALFSIFVLANTSRISVFYYMAKILVLKDRFHACSVQGVEIRGGQFISVCQVGHRVREGIPEISAIIYDSSGLIVDENNRSNEWRFAALTFSDKLPFGIAPFSAIRIYGNFYLLSFESKDFSHGNVKF